MSEQSRPILGSSELMENIQVEKKKFQAWNLGNMYFPVRHGTPNCGKKALGGIAQ